MHRRTVQALLAGLLVIIVLISGSDQFSGSRTSSLQASRTIVYSLEEPDIEDYIHSKLTEEEVTDNYIPVAIYRWLGGDQSVLCGIGSLTRGQKGPSYIVTAEHLISFEDQQVFGYRILRPLEKSIDHGISCVIRRGQDLALEEGQRPDFVLLGIGKSVRIQCTKRVKIDGVSNGEVSIFEEPFELRSIVSGEVVRALGTSTVAEDNHAEYTIIDYESVHGESGTGFVDESGQLFVLKGKVLIAEEHMKIFRDHCGDVKGFALVFGPLGFRKE